VKLIHKAQDGKTTFGIVFSGSVSCLKRRVR
jgi:hypothetical protein